MMKKVLAVLIAFCMVIDLSARGGGHGGGGRGGRGGGRGGRGGAGRHAGGRGGRGSHGRGNRGNRGNRGRGNRAGRSGWRGGYGRGYAGFYGGWGWGYFTAAGIFVALSMTAAIAAVGSARYYDENGSETDESTAKNTTINNTYNYYGDSGNKANQGQPQGEEAMEMGMDEVD
jgi:hypothetical protein